MSVKREVRRYWIRDLGTNRKEQTAVTKSFEDAVNDISFVLDVGKNEVRMKLLKKGMLESKRKMWVLLPETKNPFDYNSQKTPLSI